MNPASLLTLLASLAPQSAQDIGPTARWWADDPTFRWWTVSDVAVGNDATLVAAGRELYSEGWALYSSISEQPIAEDVDRARLTTKVGLADHAATMATLSVVQGAAGGATTLTPRLAVACGATEWTYDFSTSQYWMEELDVLVSDDGGVIVAYAYYFEPDLAEVRAFRCDGTPLGSWDLDGGAFSISTPDAVDLTDDGRRVYASVGGMLYILETASGAISFQLEWPLQLSGGSYSLWTRASMSGDGRRIAFGGYGEFQIWQETAPGIWGWQYTGYVPPEDSVNFMELNRDGSRCAYTVQDFDPNLTDGFEIRLLDVDRRVDIGRYELRAPGSTAWVYSSDLAIDDAGKTVAAASWGDSAETTPEVVVLDEFGRLLSSFDHAGSALHVDLDPTGQVLAIGTKDTHATSFGNGGDVVCGDTRPPGLRIYGYPQAGANVRLQVAPAGDTAQILAATALGASQTPFGPSELDFSTMVARAGPVPVPGSGIETTVQLPVRPDLVGRALHVQAAIYGAGAGRLSNRVSFPLLP